MKLSTSRAGLAALSGPVLRDVVTAVRFETLEMRETIHRLRRVRCCDARVRVDDERCLVVTGECFCRDFVLDMLVEADRFLARGGVPLRNPPGAVRIHIRTRSRDWVRQLRGERGAQVRTDRIRSGVVAARLPDLYHRALLEFVVQEAGSLAPLGSDAELHRRLAGLAAAEFGGSADEHLPRVVEALPRVEAAARSGRRVRADPDSDELVTWWERYVERPLGRRERADSMPLEEAAADRWPRPSDVDPGTAALGIVLDIAARLPGAPRALTLREAVDRMVRSELLPESAARRFLGNPRRVREAVALLDVLGSGAEDASAVG